MFLSQALFVKTIENVKTLYVEPLACALSIGTCTWTYVLIIIKFIQWLFYFRYAFVSATDKCAACNFPLMARSFYLFPCHHKFHSDCLIGEVTWIFFIQTILQPIKQLYWRESKNNLTTNKSKIIILYHKVWPHSNMSFC